MTRPDPELDALAALMSDFVKLIALTGALAVWAVLLWAVGT